MTVMVTGGAGYIGSHVVRSLLASGQEVLSVDDLSTGLSSRILVEKTINLDLSAPDAESVLTQALTANKVDSVIHLAAWKQVGESTSRPEEYFRNNLTGQANLLMAMRNAGVLKFVFSSSAACYGSPDVEMVSEDTRPEPINPYGQTKLVGEWMTANAEFAWGLKHVNLRYFNVAGAGEPRLADTQKLNLIPIVLAALKNGENPKVFGDDYPTEDGSCVRDYIHVVDLADAHIRALSYLESQERKFNTFNVGTGKGSSVFEVLEMIREVSGLSFEIEVAKRRSGDPARLVGDVTRIKQEMNWQAKYDLREIVESSVQALGS